MDEKTVTTPDMSCGHCAATIRSNLGALEGVEQVEADPATKRVRVRWRTPASWERIAARLRELGYPPAA